MAKRLHLIGIFHTIHNQAYSHCAFTGKALRFAKMLQNQGYEVIEYANEGSESSANEKVVMLPADRFAELSGETAAEAFHGDKASVASPLHSAFDLRVRAELSTRLQPEDIVCHPFGHAHSSLVQLFNTHRHVETGIGYPTLVPGTFKVFESEAWRHYHMGKENRSGNNYEWVIPNYFDLDEWEPSYEPGKYIAFMGRICHAKGLDTILEIARRTDLQVILCGQGDPTPWLKHPNVVYQGPLKGKERSDFIRGAVCSLMPTNFVEPFGGAGVEGMLCGTPLVSVDFGAFTETVEDGVTGYRCKTLREWLDAIELCKTIDRRKVAETARAKYSLEACGEKYARAFRMISNLDRGGWYEGCALAEV